MKRLQFILWVLPLSSLLLGCASLGSGGYNGRSDVYYTQAEAKHDAEVEQLREQKEQAEREAAQAKRELEQQKEATRRAEQEAQYQRDLAQQSKQNQVPTTQEALGPEDFDSYAEYRDYVDRGHSVRNSKQNTSSRYTDGDNNPSSYSSTPQRQDNYYYQQQGQQQPATVNNYYVNTLSTSGYYYANYCDYPDYAMIVTFDPWVYASYRYRRWYDVPWRYSWYGWDSYWCRYDYAYYYGVPYRYGYPYYPNSSYAWGVDDGYRWGYQDGFYDGYHWGNGSTPSYQPPIRNNTRRTEYAGKRPDMATMAGYGRNTRSVASLSTPRTYTSGEPMDGATRGVNTRTRSQRVPNPSYDSGDTRGNVPSNGSNTRTERVPRPTTTPSEPTRTDYNPSNTRTQRVPRPTTTPSEPTRTDYNPSPTRTQRVPRPTTTPSQPQPSNYNNSGNTRTQRVSAPAPAPSQPAPAPSNNSSNTRSSNTRSGRS